MNHGDSITTSEIFRPITASKKYWGADDEQLEFSIKLEKIVCPRGHDSNKMQPTYLTPSRPQQHWVQWRGVA